MSADEAALLRSMVALVRQRYGLDEIEAAAYVVEMPNRIKALEAENAALQSTANLLETVFAETAKELGCKQDNEAVLEAVAALRARAVPEVVWDGMLAEVGGFVLEARSGSVGWSWAIWRNGAIVSNGGGMTGVTGEQAKSACEAAFLRLVGCKNG